MRPVAGIAGAILVLVTWLSVLRTVFIPHYRGSLAARCAVTLVTAALYRAGSVLPHRARERLLGLCAPLTLFLVVLVWLCMALTGFALLAWGAAQMTWSVRGLADFFFLRQATTPTGRSAAMPVSAAGLVLAMLALLSSTLLLAAFTTHLVRVTEAYSRRERPVIRLSAQAARMPDAEVVMASYLRSESRDQLGALFGEWTGWLADVEGTHLAYPALVHYRRAGDLCWIKAAVIALDCAALIQACVPDWAPPDTGALLAAGCRCLQGIAAQLSVNLPRVSVSHHGREACSFNGTFAKMRDAGLPLVRGEAEAQAAFQRLRVEYAPYANAIADRLCCDLAESKGITLEENDEDFR